MTNTKSYTVEGMTQTTKREVTHAVVSVNYHGEKVMVLTRSPKSAVANAKSFGDTEIRVIEL